MQPAVQLRISMRLVTGINNGARAGSRAGHPFPDVVRALTHAILCSAWGLQHLSSAGDYLPRDEEWNQLVGHFGKLSVPLDQIVFVTAIGVTC
ncbi:unannotated protein [freshwater metagenome]|uniref:Unannotated protein n=1 Tax=freshwater metagenome TaxID=449393 RepID=A0A6J6TBC0_9ZZZZ